MIGDWIQRVGSSIPRGFSRFFILELLKKKSYTGKQIIDSATKQSEGKWKPSPGLIYPLLGRLLDDGLISEDKDGKYRITKKGRKTTDGLGDEGMEIFRDLDLQIGLDDPKYTIMNYKDIEPAMKAHKLFKKLTPREKRILGNALGNLMRIAIRMER